jgi:tetratricopeptide (TPR) repeat protein
MEPITTGYMFGLLVKTGIGKAASYSVDQVCKWLTFPFQTSLNNLKDREINWRGILDEIEAWWKDGGLPIFISKYGDVGIVEISQGLAQEFEKYTKGRHIYSSSQPVFQLLIAEFEIQVRQKDHKAGIRREVMGELRQEMEISNVQSRLALLETDVRLLSTEAVSQTSFDELVKRVESDLEKKYFSKLYHELIDDAKKSLANNELSRALSQLKDILTRIKVAEAESVVLFRLYINLGNCFLRLGDNDQARQFFEAAVALCPNDPKGPANLANLDYIEYEVDHALDRVKSIWDKDKSDDFVLAVLILCLTDKKERVQILELAKTYETMIGSSFPCLTALGCFFKLENDFSKADSYFKQASDIDTKNIQVRVMRVETRVKPIWIDLKALPPSERESVLSKRKDELGEIIKLANVAVEEAKSGTDRIGLARALEARAAVYLLTGDFDKGIEDCKFSQQYLPERLETKRVMARHYFQKCDYKQVIELLRMRKDLTGTDKIMVAYSYYQLKDFEFACIWFGKCTDTRELTQETKAFLYCMWNTGWNNQLTQTAAGLRLTGKIDIEVLRLELSCLTRQERWEDALDVIVKLKEVEPSKIDHRLNVLAMNMNLRRKAAALQAYNELKQIDFSSDTWAVSAFVTLEIGLMRLGWV